MSKLGKLAAIATIIAAGFTVASYFNQSVSKTDEWKGLVKQLPQKIERINPLSNETINEVSQLTATPDVPISVVLEAPEELKVLHDIANKISYSTTRNAELSKLVKIAIDKGYIEYSIFIANDISYSTTKNAALTGISETLLTQNNISAAVKAAELISYSTTKNAMLKKILAHVSKKQNKTQD